MPGEAEHLAAHVPRSAKCSLTVRYANGKRQPLGRFSADVDHGREWMWGVPQFASVGKARARVACGKFGTTTGTFVVRRPHAFGVAVTKRGFTLLLDGRNGTAVSWGVVVVNHSLKEVRGVRVDVNFVDASGNLLLQDGFRVKGIAPGAMYYAADQEYTAGYPALARILTVVRGGRSSLHAVAAPAVANVQVSEDAEGSAVVRGSLTNNGATQLSNVGVCAVFFNGAGRDIGGACSVSPAVISPGGQATFEIDAGPGGPPASSAARVGVCSMTPGMSSLFVTFEARRDAVPRTCHSLH